MIANPNTPLRLQQPLDEAIQDKNVGKIIGHITTHPDSPNVRASGSDAMGSLTLDASSSQPPSSSDEDLLALSKADLIGLLKTERKAKEKERDNFAKVLKELNEKGKKLRGAKRRATNTIFSPSNTAALAALDQMLKPLSALRNFNSLAPILVRLATLVAERGGEEGEGGRPGSFCFAQYNSSGIWICES